MSLFLIGPRGAGKSTAGALAARRLGVPFEDSDALVEAQAGCSVADLFATRGEPGFRALEREVMGRLLERDGLLVATGGGCVLDPEVCARLETHPGVVLLRADAAVLARRVRASGRPSLTGPPPDEEMAAVLARRAPLYARCARRTLDTTFLSVEQTAEALVRCWAAVHGAPAS